MRMQLKWFLRVTGTIACLAAMAPVVIAQASNFPNSILLFGPVDVRLSAVGTGYGSAAVDFNTSNQNLTCPASGIKALLSSTADGTGNVLVDNSIFLTVTAGQTVTGPTNVCIGGESNDLYGAVVQSCFTAGYQVPAGAGTIVGADPDTLTLAGGVSPIDISGSLVPGQQQVTIALQDQGSGPGFYLDNSTIYLDTNCTQGGVTGPAVVSGNPISSANPPPSQLTQSFSFNPVTNQLIGFQYDLSGAQTAGTLTIADQTIPQVADSPLDPASFQTTWAQGTSFATSNCLVHTGELLPNGHPACKLFTLECTVGTGANASGAQCPVSTVSNEVIKDIFDGPAFTLTDIPTPNGPTFHEGIGFLMASEGWTGGPCTFDPAANLTTLPCPQNLLTSFTGPGTYDGAARTTHPNSTFISIAQVPEDLTTVTVAGQQPGGWINSSMANVTFSSQPPVLAGTTLPNAAGFVASPIQTITYGISSPGTVPSPGTAFTGDTTISNNIICPTLASPTGIPAAVFNSGVQPINNLADGYYLLHYYAQDCAGTQELKFTQDGTGSWSTNFYTFAINVDTAKPAVAAGPVLSPAPNTTGNYTVGQTVTASYSCSDSLSGVARCGATTFSTPVVGVTSTLTSAVDTSSPGMKTFTVVAIDAAGNQSSSSVNYQVVSPYDSQIQVSLNPSTVTYPGGTTLTVTIAPTPAVAASVKASALVRGKAKIAPQCASATGSVQIYDGVRLLQTLELKSNGTAQTLIAGLAAGNHSISVVYSGDAQNPGGTSAPVILTVLPGLARLLPVCSSSTLTSGQDYSCIVYVNGGGGFPAQGVFTYAVDGGTPVAQTLIFGLGLITVHKPAVGPHSVVIGFAAQGSYLAAPSVTETFSVKAH